jgi:lipoprotein-releasing system permease protein
MIKPLSLHIAWRYTRAKKRNQFVSFISLASMLGIALGIAVLITVLSVMNGFDYQIKTRFFAVAPQVTVVTEQNLEDQWSALEHQAYNVKGVVASAPFVNGKGMLTHDGMVSGVQVLGINPSREEKISKLNKKMVSGSLNSLTPGSYHIVLGMTLASNLGLQVGDKVVLLTPQTSVSPLGIAPRYRQFTVSGIFHVGGGFGFDNGVAYTSLQDAQRLFLGAQRLSGLHIKLRNLYDAPSITSALAKKFPPGFQISNWTQTYGAFFHALAMEKTMMFIILILIVAVAAFNLVSTLVMVVNDKQSEIAILRTLGARRSMIMATFIFQGAIVGILGTLIGVIAGLLLASNATAIVNEIQHVFHVQFIQSSVYFIDYLPSKIEFSDVLHVAFYGFVLSLVATIYPAFRAFKCQPAEALRYE